MPSLIDEIHQTPVMVEKLFIGASEQPKVSEIVNAVENLTQGQSAVSAKLAKALFKKFRLTDSGNGTRMH